MDGAVPQLTATPWRHSRSSLRGLRATRAIFRSSVTETPSVFSALIPKRAMPATVSGLARACKIATRLPAASPAGFSAISCGVEWRI